MSEWAAIITIVMILLALSYSVVLPRRSVDLGVNQPPSTYMYPRQNKVVKRSNDCWDNSTDCPMLKHLCDHPVHKATMESRCPSTCNLCSSGPTLPEIRTLIAENAVNDSKMSASSSSLSKVIIKGTCYDEYIYCHEFLAMCQHPEYEDLMSLHCSLSCDRCEIQHKSQETCEDYTNCANFVDLCDHPFYSRLLEEQCRRTCKHCEAEEDGCRNRHKNCDKYKLDGFCENPVYSLEEKTYLCGVACELCG